MAKRGFNVRCNQCNSDNPATNRFCGQCGNALQVSQVQENGSDEGWDTDKKPIGPVSSAFFEDMSRQTKQLQDFRQRTSQASTGVRDDAEEHVPTSVVTDARPEAESRGDETDKFFSSENKQDEPPISGPSFLGLSNDAGSSPVEYLYEEPSGNKARYVLAILIAAAFLGFIAYEWHQGWNWTTTIVGKYRAVRGIESPKVATSAAPAEAVNAQTPLTQQPLSSSTPPGGLADNGNTAIPAKEDLKTAEAGNSAAQTDPGEESRDSVREEKDLPTERDKAEKLSARSSKEAAVGDDLRDKRLLSQADAYLYGRGTKKNCHQALTYLRTAANQGSAAARSKLGGLYATGNCVPLDRAEAYNWFTLARDAGAKTSWTEHNRIMLWAEMSAAEKARVMEPLH